MIVSVMGIERRGSFWAVKDMDIWLEYGYYVTYR